MGRIREVHRGRGPRLRARVLDLARARGGAVAIVFALSLIPVAIAVGAAIDVGRAYVVKSRLAYALDAAGLAVGSAPTSDEDELQQILEDYFAANYPEEKIGVPAKPEMEIDGSEFHLSAKADLPTTLMNLIGIHNLEIATSSVIVKEMRKIEVALALDVTGSMAGSKIEALKEAAHAFVEIVFADEATSETVRVALVPFSSSVNIGTNNDDYVKDMPGAPDRFAPATWEGCIEARPYPYDVEDTYVDSDSNDGHWRAYAWPPHIVQNNWPPVTSAPPRGPNKHCPSQAILPLSDTRSTIDTAIDGFAAAGQTNVAIGALFAWAALSPEEPFTEGADYDDDDTKKIAIIMTDGENFVSTTTGSYSAYGTVTEANDALNCPTNLSTCKVGELDNRTEEVCDNIKDEGITVYTVGFDLADASPVLSLLEDCASDPNKFFDSPSSADLEAAFATIGNELVNIRIGQ
jgi:Flp pilus assembly protein TadG